MPSLIELICLANSRKKGDRCIAGIDRKTGRWVRPVYQHYDGEIPRQVRLIDGKEPEILNVIKLSVGRSYNTYGFQYENRLIEEVPWEKVDRVNIDEIKKYCCDEKNILHTSADDKINHAILTKTDVWHSSLQLWETTDFNCYPADRGWRGRFTNKFGMGLDAKITDPIFEQKMYRSKNYSSHCLLVVSLGSPFRPGGWNEEYCWKLIATIIELENS